MGLGGEVEDGEGRDDGGIEAAGGGAGQGGWVHVEDELRAGNAAGTLLPAVTSTLKVHANMDVEAKHYDDNDKENNNGDQYYLAGESVVVFASSVVVHVFEFEPCLWVRNRV